MAKKSNLFTTLDSINNKTKLPEDEKILSGYMLSLWMAQDRELIKYANEINPYIFNMPDEIVYKFFFNKVPKKRRFIKWTKKSDEKKQSDIDRLCIKYNISEKEAKLSL